ALADGLTDGSADSLGWRTAPLIGLRFAKIYLHDGRAGSIDEAIQAHDGEAAASATAYRALSAADRQTLLDYVGAL
ncbi:MAG TPA: di-heme oxidoredictase family protein, partial [Kofleriaceae bacterium]|nr:di-heme oxidoredictase family protein [Kofleriaceae bacterium]